MYLKGLKAFGVIKAPPLLRFCGVEARRPGQPRALLPAVVKCAAGPLQQTMRTCSLSNSVNSGESAEPQGTPVGL